MAKVEDVVGFCSEREEQPHCFHTSESSVDSKNTLTVTSVCCYCGGETITKTSHGPKFKLPRE